MNGLQTISRIARAANGAAERLLGTDGTLLLRLMQLQVRAMEERIASRSLGLR